MKFICSTCNKEWISDKDREGQPYECPLCEKKRLEVQKKEPSGTTNSMKAAKKNNHNKYNTKN